MASPIEQNMSRDEVSGDESLVPSPNLQHDNRDQVSGDDSLVRPPNAQQVNRDEVSGDDSLEPSQAKKGRKANRPGRKGDPRMNAAVAARLANPNISMIEALRLGGFNYPEGHISESFILDKDTVSFGQRRNQLCRRIRLAKEKSGLKEKANLAEKQARLERLVAPSESQRASLPGVAGGTRRGREYDEMGEIEAMERERAFATRLRMQRFNPEFSRSLAPLNYGRFGSAPSHPLLLASLLAPPQTGHPQLDHGFAPSLPHRSSDISALRRPAAPLSTLVAHRPPMSQVLNGQEHRFPSSGAASHLDVQSSFADLELEQMASALHSATNLAESLSNQFLPDGKAELALNVHRSERSNHFQRCMRLAGYDGEDMQEGSLAYKLFAFKAWSEDGKRLIGEIERVVRLLGDVETGPDSNNIGAFR